MPLGPSRECGPRRERRKSRGWLFMFGIARYGPRLGGLADGRVRGPGVLARRPEHPAAEAGKGAFLTPSQDCGGGPFEKFARYSSTESAST